MSEDLVRKYHIAKDEMDIALSNLEALTERIESVTDTLKHNPWKFAITNINSTKIQIPATVVSRATVFLDSKDWPTAEQIAEKLVLAHRARYKVWNLWRAIPESEKKKLTPP